MILNCGAGEDSWEFLGLEGDQASQSPKGDQYSSEGLMLKLKLQYFGHVMQRAHSLGKDPDAGKDWGQEENGMTEDEMAGWQSWLNGHEFEQTPGDSEGQGSLVCCSPWVKKSQTQFSNWTTTFKFVLICYRSNRKLIHLSKFIKLYT